MIGWCVVTNILLTSKKFKLYKIGKYERSEGPSIYKNILVSSSKDGFFLDGRKYRRYYTNLVCSSSYRDIPF